MPALSKDHMDFYVYVLFRADGRPFYVGKGRGRRWLHHEWYASTGKRMSACASLIKKTHDEGIREIPKVKVAENLSASLAVEYEIAWIAALGRKSKGGILLNMTDGGEGPLGYIPSPEARAKNGASHRGSKRSERGRANIIAGITGRRLSDEHKAKFSKIRSGTTLTDETKAKVSASLVGNVRKLGFRDPMETLSRKSAAQHRRNGTSPKVIGAPTLPWSDQDQLKLGDIPHPFFSVLHRRSRKPKARKQNDLFATGSPEEIG